MQKQNDRLAPAVQNHLVSRKRSDRGGDPLLKLCLRRGADLARGHLATFENHQGRDRHHAVFRRGLRALVDVQLDDLDLVAHRTGNLVERRSDHATRAAPFSPEIDNDRALRLEHFGFEIGVGNLTNGHLNTSFGSGDAASSEESPQGSCNPNYERTLAGSSFGVPLPMDASSASSEEAEISINSVVSVQSNAVRIGFWG